MSGPVGMTLGAFAFESLGFGYEMVGRRLNTQWADVPVAQGLDQQQWTGPTSEEVTIRGVLFPVEYGGQASLEGIIAAANAGTPLMLVSGSNVQGIIHGLYTVQSIDEDRSIHNRHGVPGRNGYSISLKRYGRAVSGGGLGSILSLFG